jgi:hypothetical protein
MTARALFLSAVAVISLAVTGCAADVVPIATPTPTETAANIPSFQPEGDAFANKVYFDWVLEPVATANQDQPGKALVNALVHAGFPKRNMQVTFDLTQTKVVADSVIVAVRVGSSCLIGQRTVGKDYYSTIETALSTGGCLIGITRKIDW